MNHKPGLDPTDHPVQFKFYFSQIDERVVLDKQNYLMDKNGADNSEDAETEDVDSDVMKAEAEEGLDTISNEGNEAEEKLENLKENLDKDDDILGESEQ